MGWEEEEGRSCESMKDGLGRIGRKKLRKLER
jgi:hypothetical protein